MIMLPVYRLSYVSSLFFDSPIQSSVYFFACLSSVSFTDVGCSISVYFSGKEYGQLLFLGLAPAIRGSPTLLLLGLYTSGRSRSKSGVKTKNSRAKKVQMWRYPKVHHYSVKMTLFRKYITRTHGSALRCVRSDSRSIWNMANLTPL